MPLKPSLADRQNATLGYPPFYFLRRPLKKACKLWQNQPEGNMFQLLLLSITCPILDLTAARFLQNSGSVLMAQQMHTKPKCPIGQYESKGICCDLCEPGSVAKSLGCTENRKTNCIQCVEGKEYMDKYNFNPACLRCNLCDAEHGLETEKNCTIYQNVICRCKPRFFCDLTTACRHCDPCDECENGIIVEKCTQTQNTVCGNKGNY
ncbi:tumor necrosis factor receptor superfamily member 6 [Candoia aspera]|uniref:tumor necrosis factor receptor superfamily member 6 n=1 Tax=Candoia aspera TaxID=51853 RepID=UPI002FD82CDA